MMLFVVLPLDNLRAVSFRHADSEDSDHTWRMQSLIRIFAWRMCHIVGRLCLFYYVNTPILRFLRI